MDAYVGYISNANLKMLAGDCETLGDFFFKKCYLGNNLLDNATVTGTGSNDTYTGGFDRLLFIYSKEQALCTRIIRDQGTSAQFRQTDKFF